MSDTYYDIFKNLINIDLDEQHLQNRAKPIMLPHRKSSVFSPPSSLSSEQLTDESFGWSAADIWSEEAPSKPSFPFRSDRSMSLTDWSLSKKPLDVPPPPGFPPLSAPQHASNRYKTELCRSFQESGCCKYGSKCQFAHGESELRGLYRHPKYKTEACRTFYNFGYCPYGSRCHFIHEEKLGQQKNPGAATTATSSGSTATGHPRLLRQSVSFAGFLGSRSISPPTLYEPLGFSRAPSVSPPPASHHHPTENLLSPVFSDTTREVFGFPPSRGCETLLVPEPRKPSRCMCGQTVGNKYAGKENRVGGGGSGLAAIQRFASDESLSDRESFSSGSSSAGSSSGSESPTFDGASSKRLTVFARMSLSE